MEVSKPVKTPLSSMIYFLVAALVGALGQFLYKSGAERATDGFFSYLLNVRILGGVVCYIAVMVLFVAAFRRGGELSILYPLYATTFIWAAGIAWWAYEVPIKPINLLGMVCLIAGMFFMGK
jgi:multidrug transporter EmrE-like cation transporter